MILKEEPEQTLSWKQGSILGQTVDFELYAQWTWAICPAICQTVDFELYNSLGLRHMITG